MDAVELPLPAAIVSKIMSGCSSGVTRVEFAKSERELSTTSLFHQDKDENRNLNGSRPAFWSNRSDEDLYRQGGQLTSLRNEEALVDHDMGSVPEAKHSLRKSGKAARSNGNSSRRSRVAHMEATLNVTGEVNISDVPKELGLYSGKYNISDKTHIAKQKTIISGKRSDKRNGKVSKSRFDSFSIKAGLSSFSSAAGGNNMLGVYASKQDIYDFEKHVDEIYLNELLDGNYKCPKSIKENEKKTEILHKSVLVSIRAASSILQLQKPKQTPNVAAVDGTNNNNASSSLPNSAVSGTSTNNDSKGDAADPSSCNKVDNSCSGLIDHHTNVLQFPLVAPKEVLDRLSLPPPKDLDVMLLDSMKPTSTSKVQNGGSLPTFPWSHVSGFKANPDVVKSTPNKSSCQGKWFRMPKSTTSSGDTTSYLEDFQSLTYNKSLVPLECQQPGPTENEKSLMPSVSNATFDREVTPSGTRTSSSKSPVEPSAGALSAAQILCDIAARCRKLDQDGMVRWQKKSSQKSIRPSKLTSDEKLEKALFTIPSSKFIGPSNLINGLDETKSHTPKKFRMPVNEKSNDFSNPTTKGPYHWPTVTPQSSRSSPNKTFKNTSMEAKHHESSSSGLKRAITTPPSRLPSKPPKLRKLVPMEWKSRGDQKGNGKY